MGDLDAFIDEFEHLLDSKNNKDGRVQLVDVLHRLVFLDEFLKQEPNASSVFHQMTSTPFNLTIESNDPHNSRSAYTLQANLFTVCASIMGLKQDHGMQG